MIRLNEESRLSVESSESKKKNKTLEKRKNMLSELKIDENENVSSSYYISNVA